MIRLDNVTKSFQEEGGGKHVVLDNLDLNIEAGEFVSLMGPSGCGKSTLLNILAGILQMDSGTLRYEGEAVSADDFFAAYVFQEPRLLNWRTVGENIEFALNGQNVPEEEHEKRITQELERVGLLDERDSYPLRLSGGMQQRVGLARALAVNPDLILMDEPFSALDELTARDLREDVVDLWQETGKTILFVTHDIAEAIYLADRIMLMNGSGNIFEEIGVELSRPRSFEDPALNEIEADVMDDFYAQINVA
jgi:NitT/TauT family transport system ATP-binding protein